MDNPAIRAGTSGLLPCLAVLLLLAWGTHDVYSTFAYEDSGRDLYAAWRFSEGELPYRDFQWNYGPLVLAYYAGLFRLLGPSVLAMMAGYKGLQVAACLFTFVSARRLVGSALAVGAAAVHFFFLNLHHTFNHAGTSLLIAAWTWLVVRNTDPGRPLGRGAVGGMAGVVVGLFWTKPTMGVAVSLGTCLFLLLKGASPGRRIGWPWGRLACVGLLAPALGILGHVPLMWGLPADRWGNCTGLGAAGTPGGHHFSPLQMIETPVRLLLDPAAALDRTPLQYFLAGALTAVLLVWGFPGMARFLRSPSTAGSLLPVFGPIGYLVLGHEFPVIRNQDNLGYNVSGVWSLVLAGLGAHAARNGFGLLPVRYARAVAAVFLVAFGARGAVEDALRLRWSGEGRYVASPRGRVWIWDRPYQETLLTTVERLEAVTEPLERVAYFPRGDLALFLAGRRRATWLGEVGVTFMRGVPWEEDRILAEMRSPPVRWVIASNFMRRTSMPAGDNFGEDFGGRIVAALEAEYEEIARIPPGPLRIFGPELRFNVDDHQVRFLRRKTGERR